MKDRGIARRAGVIGAYAAGGFAMSRWPKTTMGALFLLWILFGKELRKNDADSDGAGNPGTPGQ
jgi:hypothetical protein